MQFPPLVWFLTVLFVVAAVMVLGLFAVDLALRRLDRRQPKVWRGWLRVRRPLGATLLVTSARITFIQTAPDFALRPMVAHALLIGAIASGMWLAATLVLYLIDASQSKITFRKMSDQQRRRAQTQLQLIRRLVSANFIKLAIAMTLLTFPAVERIGTGLFASAGVISVIAGLAAQSSLANLFAGIQLTFSDAIRLDDVVEVDGEWGTIEDITLSYVVVKIWDERRLVLPTTYFTTTPYKNWTRKGSQIVGTVKFDVELDTDLDGLRTRLAHLLEESSQWDGRSQSLVVTEASPYLLTIQISISAADSDRLWSLQCLIREDLAGWLHTQNKEKEAHEKDKSSAPDPAEELLLAGSSVDDVRSGNGVRSTD